MIKRLAIPHLATATACIVSSKIYSVFSYPHLTVLLPLVARLNHRVVKLIIAGVLI